MQSSQANCGPTALHNALLTLGIQRSEAELEQLCATSATHGTSVRGLLRGAAKIEGLLPVQIRERRADVAMLRLRFAIDVGRPVLVLWRVTDPGDHWVAVVGRLGETYLIADSGDHELVVPYSIEAVVNNWYDGSGYYGVQL